jgi:Zn-dependent metalloprotease
MTHIRISQQVHGVPVYGSELIVHLSGKDEFTINGRYFA